MSTRTRKNANWNLKDSYRQPQKTYETNWFLYFKYIVILKRCDFNEDCRAFIQFCFIKDQDENTFKFVRFEEFLVVAEVVSFVVS